jgi:hypothetical protein
LSGRCRTYAATRSLEHGHANGFFELTNATAQRRLPHKQSLGSSPEASIFRGNYGVSEVLEGDRRGFIANRQVLAFWFVNHSRSSNAFERAGAQTRYSESGDFQRSVVFFIGPRRAGWLRKRGPQPTPSGALARHERRRQDREHAKGGDVPEQRADERYTGYIKYSVSDAPAASGAKRPFAK